MSNETTKQDKSIPPIPTDIAQGLSDALAEKIAQLGQNKNARSINNDNAGSTGPSIPSVGTVSNPTNIASAGTFSNNGRVSKLSEGTGRQPNRGIDFVSDLSTQNRHSNRTEQSDTGTTGNNPKSTFSMRAATSPVDRENPTGGNDRGNNGNESGRIEGNGTNEPSPVVVDTPVPGTLRRGRKPKSAQTEEVSLDVITYAIETGFAITGSIRGPHWVRTTEQCQAVSIPLKKCLDRLPSKIADKVNNWIDPAAAAISLYLLIIPGIAYEQAVRSGRLPHLVDNETQVPNNVSPNIQVPQAFNTQNEPSNSVQGPKNTGPNDNTGQHKGFGNRFRSPIIDN